MYTLTHKHHDTLRICKEIFNSTFSYSPRKMENKRDTHTQRERERDKQSTQRSWVML